MNLAYCIDQTNYLKIYLKNLSTKTDDTDEFSRHFDTPSSSARTIIFTFDPQQYFNHKFIIGKKTVVECVFENSIPGLEFLMQSPLLRFTPLHVEVLNSPFADIHEDVSLAIRTVDLEFMRYCEDVSLTTASNVLSVKEIETT